jgi:LGFP repeat-containing protein
MSDVRFRQVSDYAGVHGFVGGFPNFHEARSADGRVFGTVLIRPGKGQWRDIRASDLGNPPGTDWAARFRATSDYAGRNGFVGGFPNFHEANYGEGVVYGTVLFKADAAEWRDVPAADLGNPPPGDFGARFRATNDYARREGFAAGFPNFYQADYGRGLVYGTILLRDSAIEWRDVREEAFSGSFRVYGAIRDRYNAIGAASSWLGLPTSDEMDFTEGGRVTLFQHGAIYWWPDTGAIELGKVAVRYKGLYCFGETNEPSAADEPYVIMGVVPAPPAPTSEAITKIYDDVDAGNSRPDELLLYKGRPDGLGLAVTLWEHDAGDRDAYLDAVKKGVATGGAIITSACGLFGGPAAAVICGGLWGVVSAAIVEAINELIGSADDLIGTDFVVLTAKQLVTLARAPRSSFWGIDYHVESKLLSDNEASYKVYFEIAAV